MAIELETWHRWWKLHGCRQLRDLLMLWWDPIGVYGVPDAIDEYDGDVGRVGRLLREGAGQDELAACFEEQDFGIDPDPDRDRLAARKVLEWYERSMQRLEQPTAP